MSGYAFAPAQGASTAVNNAIAATAAVTLPENADMVRVANTSTTAFSYVRVTTYNNTADIGTGDAPTAGADIMIGTSGVVEFYVGRGPKVIRTIASAADGKLQITPGRKV